MDLKKKNWKLRGKKSERDVKRLAEIDTRRDRSWTSRDIISVAITVAVAVAAEALPAPALSLSLILSSIPIPNLIPIRVPALAVEFPPVVLFTNPPSPLPLLATIPLAPALDYAPPAPALQRTTCLLPRNSFCSMKNKRVGRIYFCLKKNIDKDKSYSSFEGGMSFAFLMKSPFER